MKQTIIFPQGYAEWLQALQQKLHVKPNEARRLLYVSSSSSLRDGAGIVVEHCIGSINEGLADELFANQLIDFVEHEGEGIAVLPSSEEPSECLYKIAHWLYSNGWTNKWRNEQMAVLDSEGLLCARMDRSAVRLLGVLTRAVYLLGLVEDGRIWLQRRSFSKDTGAGQLDLLVGGLMSADEGEMEALGRETEEEAGLELGGLPSLQKRGVCHVERPVGRGGYMREEGHWYTAVLPIEVKPINQDGEVIEFVLLSPQEVIAAMMAGEVTPEACQVLNDFLRSH